MASVDLTDAYFHIEVVPAHCQFLRFWWLGQAYQFEALPFSLFSALRVFTKTTVALLVAWLRLMGVQLYPYLDDILLLGESARDVEQSVQTTLQVLRRAGVYSEPEKSDLVPTQDLMYIGARFRTDLGRVYLPEDRIAGHLAMVKSFSRVGQYQTAAFSWAYWAS